MQRFEGTAWNNQTGLPVANPTVTVYHVGTVITATIYADEGVTTKSNPFAGDAQGRFSFYALDGDYDVLVEGAGITPYTLADLTLGDAKRATGLTEYEVYLLANAFYHRQSAEWRRRDTGRPTWTVVLDADSGDDVLRILRAAAGANPVTWLTLWQLTSAAKWLATLAANSALLAGRVTGDTADRVVIKNDRIEFGPGTAAADVVLQRGAADRLDLLDALRLSLGLSWATDNAQDIGASGANRPRDLFLGRHAVIGGALDHDGSTVGFYGKTPAAQAAASANLTDNSGGTANDTVQALTDPADTPADADALRDDLVANLIPELRNNFADLTAKVNKALTVLRDLGLLAT